MTIHYYTMLNAVERGECQLELEPRASLESYRIQSIHSLLCIVLTPMGLEPMDPEVC